MAVSSEILTTPPHLRMRLKPGAFSRHGGKQPKAKKSLKCATSAFDAESLFPNEHPPPQEGTLQRPAGTGAVHLSGNEQLLLRLRFFSLLGMNAKSLSPPLTLSLTSLFSHLHRGVHKRGPSPYDQRLTAVKQQSRSLDPPPVFPDPFLTYTMCVY